MYLQYNKLGSHFVKSIAKVVKYDEYLKVLDIRNNKINTSVVKQDLIPALKNNSSLTNLDIRFNNCATMKNLQIIALCLLKNIDSIKNA